MYSHPGCLQLACTVLRRKKRGKRGLCQRAEACCNTDYTNSITNIAFEFLFLVSCFLFLVSCFVLFVAVAFCCVLLLFVVVVVVVVF